MIRTPLFAALALAAVAGCAPKGEKDAGADGAVAIVEAIYKPYRDGAPAPAWFDAAPFTPDMRALIDKLHAAETAGGGEVIDADPTVGGNDAALSDIKVAAGGAPVAHKVVVNATFRNGDTPVTAHFDMAESDGAWEVDNIRSATTTVPDYDLRKDITAGIAEVSAPLKP